MLSMTFTTILTCSTRHEKKQILDHVIHDVLPVQKHVLACFGERHQNHCFLIVIINCMFTFIINYMFTFIINCMFTFIINCMFTFIIDCMLDCMFTLHVSR